LLRGHDSGVENRDTGDGCTINDLIDDESTWKNHGAFMDHVTDVANRLRSDGVIDKQSDTIAPAVPANPGTRRTTRSEASRTRVISSSAMLGWFREYPNHGYTFPPVGWFRPPGAPWDQPPVLPDPYRDRYSLLTDNLVG
jgi:hypothetical protein